MRKREKIVAAYDLRLISGNANRALAARIAEELEIPLTRAEVKRFSDGEIRVKIEESVRGADAFIVQPTCPPVSENLMELLILMDALKRASARRIVAVVPYYGYARQEKKTGGREPITAKLVADLMTTAGADRLLVMDLHVPSIQGFFNLPVDHLPASPIIAKHLIACGLGGPETVVVSPDVGGVPMATGLADRLRAGLAIVAKRRPGPNHVQVIDVIGELEGKRVVFIDDIVDTGRSLAVGAEAVARRGAAQIWACATHGVLSAEAADLIQDSLIKQLVITDTVPVASEASRPKIEVLSVAPLLARAIRRVHEDESVSSLLREGEV